MSPTNVVKTNINFTNYSFDSLLDTGALQGNYLRADKVEELTKAGVQVKETNVHICAAFGDCVKADCIISLCVVFNDIELDNLLCNNISIRDFNTKPYRVRLDFLVVKELPFEMIVGRRAIITHKLWERCVTSPHLIPDLRNLSLDALLDYTATPKIAKQRTQIKHPPTPKDTKPQKGHLSDSQTDHHTPLQVESPVGIQTKNSSVATTRKRKRLTQQLISQMDLHDGEITNSETVLEPRRSLAPGQDEALPAWLITDRQQLLHLSENCRPMERPDKSTSSSKWIRAHITEVFNYEDEAWGESVPGTDLPEYA